MSLLEGLTWAQMGMAGLGAGGAVGGYEFWKNVVNSNGGTTSKWIDKAGGKVDAFVQRIDDNTLMRYNHPLGLNGEVVKPSSSTKDLAKLGVSSISTVVNLEDKLKKMCKSFGIVVKNPKSYQWINFVNLYKAARGLIGSLVDSQDTYRFGDKAKTGVRESELEAARKALYESGILKEATSLTSGSWTLPLKLTSIAPFKGDVAQSVVDYLTGVMFEFTSDTQKTEFVNSIMQYVTGSVGIFELNVSAFPSGAQIDITYADSSDAYDVELKESDGYYVNGPFLIGTSRHITNTPEKKFRTRNIVLTNSDPEESSTYAMYKQKVKVHSVHDDDTRYLWDYCTINTKHPKLYQLETDSEGKITGNAIDASGKLHVISEMEYDDFFVIGWDGTNYYSIRADLPEGSDSYYVRSLCPYTVATSSIAIDGVSGHHVGETIEELILYSINNLDYNSYNCIFGCRYGMRSGSITSLADKTDFSKTDDQAKLPDRTTSLEELYKAWYEQSKALTEVYLKANNLVTEQERVLPLSLSDAMSQAVSQAGTDVYDYVNSKVLAGADTLVQSIASTATAAITKAIAVPAVVPIIPTGTAAVTDLSGGGGAGAGLWQMYNPSESQISKFGGWLWEDPVQGLGAPGDTLKKLFQNPMDAIISLHKVYVSPQTSGSTNIKVGYLDSGVSAPKISNRYVNKNMGSVTINNINGNFMDYEGVDLVVYLPFIGMRALDTSVCMGATLTLTYNVDVLTGTLVAFMSVKKNGIDGVIYQWSGSMFESVPLTSSDMSSAVRGALGLVGGAVTTVAGALTANPAGVIGGVSGMASSATNIHTNIQSCGSIGGNAGVLASRQPYIVLTITQTFNPYNWRDIKGLPDNRTASIGSCSGYIEGDNPEGNSGMMSSEEWDEFKNLLRSGIHV